MHGFAIDIVDRKLTLGIRAEPRQTAILAHFSLALHQAVRVVDRQRHERRCFVAGVTKHQTLVASALVEIDPLTFVNALCNIR